MIERLKELVNADQELVRRGRFLDVDFLLQIGETQHLISIRAGRITEIERGDRLMRPWRFAIRASDAAWTAFWQPVPEPGYHDLFAMSKSGDATIEGDLQPLMANLRFIKELLAMPRHLVEAR